MRILATRPCGVISIGTGLVEGAAGVMRAGTRTAPMSSRGHMNDEWMLWYKQEYRKAAARWVDRHNVQQHTPIVLHTPLAFPEGPGGCWVPDTRLPRSQSSTDQKGADQQVADQKVDDPDPPRC